MNKKRSIVFQIVISLFIIAGVYFVTILNTSEFLNKYYQSSAESNYIILNSLIARIEYGLKYGKELDNYYDIDSTFSDLEKYCNTSRYFIIDAEGNHLYGEEPPEWAKETGERLTYSQEPFSIVENDDVTGLLTSITVKDETVGYAGILFHPENVNRVAGSYVSRMYFFALYVSLGAAILFLILFRTIPHRYQVRKLILIVLPVLILANVVSLANTWYVFQDGYRTIATRIAENLAGKGGDDMERLLANGVRYQDIRDIDSYYTRIADSIEQVESIAMLDAPVEGAVNRQLSADETGKSYCLSIKPSSLYVRSRVRTALMNVLVSMVTSVMIASEMVLFLIGIIIEDKKERLKKQTTDNAVSLEHVEVVRGLSFFFASFRYMSVAFMAVVLAQIYRPVSIFGYEIPYEIVMSIPLSAQVLISMITSYISGSVMEKRGWKNPTLFGVMVMSFGTLASAFAREPIPFILAQMCVGVGLGFAKMGIDVYAVVVASEKEMSIYTANSNASIIVGFSCSALIGALLANIFGYSGAYIFMSVLGAAVFLLIMFFGMDVISVKKEEEGTEALTGNSPLDMHFVAYILCIILPYSFLMMFVDYFFPVYAVSRGITMDVIGYVMLFYGMATAYIGTTICERLSQKFPAKALMTGVLVLLGVMVLVFSVGNLFILAAMIVLLLGISDGIMPSAQFDYVYHLPLSKRIGFSKALGIEGFFSSLIGALAPIVFGIVMMKGNIGLAIVAAITLLAAGIFFLANRGSHDLVKRASMILLLLLAAALFRKSVQAFETVRADEPAQAFESVQADEPAQAFESVQADEPAQAVESGQADEPTQTVESGQADEPGRPLTFGYCQAESYYEFDYQLYDIAAAMAERGEISPLPQELHEGSSAFEVWKALSEAESSCYSFPIENFIDLSSRSYSSLDDQALQQRLSERLASMKPDLILTMGTASGLAIKEACDLPYMNFIASDPVDSGIVEGADYSGTSRGWAHVNNSVDQKALSVMYDIFQPRKVGIIYNMESPDAYIYSAAKSVDLYASRFGFSVTPMSVSDDIDDSDEAYDSYLKNMIEAHEKLALEDIDLYILTSSLLNPEDFSTVLAPMVQKGIPVFSLNSTEDVRYGAMAAVEMFDYVNIGRFAADSIARYRQGEGLDTLSQKYDTAPFLVLNIDTLQKTGITLPLDLFLSTNIIYQEYHEEADFVPEA